MSEFRIFCIGCFFGIGGGAFLANRGLLRADLNASVEALLLFGMMVGCFAVFMFGRRAS